LISLNIFFGMSKISFFVTVFIIFGIFSSFVKGHWLAISSVLILLLVLVSYHFSPKLQEMVRSTSEYSEVLKEPSKNYSSTAVRILTWNATYNVLKKSNLLIGNGSGDTKDILMEYYRIHNYRTPYEKKLNSHNQFLETLNGTGILGFTFLICFQSHKYHITRLFLRNCPSHLSKFLNIYWLTI
jgi:O-antigen ligase